MVKLTAKNLLSQRDSNLLDTNLTCFNLKFGKFKKNLQKIFKYKKRE